MIKKLYYDIKELEVSEQPDNDLLAVKNLIMSLENLYLSKDYKKFISIFQITAELYQELNGDKNEFIYILFENILKNEYFKNTFNQDINNIFNYLLENLEEDKLFIIDQNLDKNILSLFLKYNNYNLAEKIINKYHFKNERIDDYIISQDISSKIYNPEYPDFLDNFIKLSTTPLNKINKQLLLILNVFYLTKTYGLKKEKDKYFDILHKKFEVITPKEQEFILSWLIYLKKDIKILEKFSNKYYNFNSNNHKALHDYFFSLETTYNNYDIIEPYKDILIKDFNSNNNLIDSWFIKNINNFINRNTPVDQFIDQLEMIKDKLSNINLFFFGEQVSENFFTKHKDFINDFYKQNYFCERISPVREKLLLAEMISLNQKLQPNNNLDISYKSKRL